MPMPPGCRRNSVNWCSPGRGCRRFGMRQGFNGLYRSVHSLAGSGSTLGFSALSEAARELENYLKPLGANQQLPNPEQRTLIDGLLGNLQHAAGQPDKSLASYRN